MNVIARTLFRRGDTLTYQDGQTGHGEYRMSGAEWVELQKPVQITVQISTASTEVKDGDE